MKTALTGAAVDSRPDIEQAIKRAMSVRGHSRRGGDSRMSTHVRYSLLLLKKSFGGGGRNFLEPLMRFVRDDVRGLVASLKNDHGLSYRRYGAS
ncbi:MULTISPECIES: hypothetical protein [Bradyrhizobium]|nr:MULTISPECIES: hypothetical protein [Bradyrhizobium]